MSRKPSPAAVPVLLLLLTAALLAALPAADAGASGYGRFQVGGRGVAQVGAFVARADDPAAVRYNPAGLSDLEGLRLSGGLDFNNATDEYRDAFSGSTFRADHSIQFTPSIYLTWSDEDRLGNWSLGVGVDTPHWYRADFDPVFFPLRGEGRVTELEIWELHPVVAYRLNDGWSVGGGLRYQYGGFLRGFNSQVVVPGANGPGTGEIFVDADADVDGLGFDLGTRYRATLWGFGAVYRSPVELEGDGNVVRSIRDAPADPVAADNLEDLLRAAGSPPFDTTLELPWELATGFWFAPYPELRFELDLVLAAWSDFEQTFRGRTVAGLPSPRATVESGWDDTLSLRLGVEGEVSDFLTLSGGVALEPSPVPGDRASPAFFRGDATVYAVGASFAYETVTFDLGYSLHDHDDVDVARIGIPEAPSVDGTFSSDDQVWSASVRYRF